MRKVLFLDTNVIMDIVFERGEFQDKAIQLFILQQKGLVDLHISTLTLAHIAYFAKKFGKNPKVVVAKVLKSITAVDLTMHHFENSIRSKFSDFEDALQYFAAKDIKGIDFIITRNDHDFKHSEIPVLSPKAFVSNFSLDT
ncbi:MAG: PIN domain-containing protein [Cyclobacteriaceae bacterium]|nr:PIN domain-containing protein [Cyclobacteriaceae bacterium]